MKLLDRTGVSTSGLNTVNVRAPLNSVVLVLSYTITSVHIIIILIVFVTF